MQSFWSFAQLLFDWVSDRLLSAEHFCPPETWLPWWIRFFGRWGIYISSISLQDETRSGPFHRAILNHGVCGVCDGFDSLSVLVAFRLIHPEHHSQAVLANALDSKSWHLMSFNNKRQTVSLLICPCTLCFALARWEKLNKKSQTPKKTKMKKCHWKPQLMSYQPVV